MDSRNCPYCGSLFNVNGVDAYNTILNFQSVGRMLAGGSSERFENEPQYTVTCHRCPACWKQIIWLNEVGREDRGTHVEQMILSTSLLFPKHPVVDVPKEVPGEFAEDFREASLVIEVSPKASAALSRRCLQNLIRKQEGITKKSLDAEIADLLALKKLPSSVAEDLDAVRQVGNFAAHPIKDQTTGQIVEVEDHEAEWTLDVLRELFDFYFVQPARSQSRRAQFNAKLSAAGKPALKKP